MRDFERPNRSAVVSTGGMAATSNPASTLAAVNVLRDGGNAMDAAIAACAVQCVVEPGSTGIGGDCFCLYAPGGGADVIAFNGSGRSPAAAAPEWYWEHGFNTIPPGSPHAVTVPGAVDAWTRLAADHGTRPLGELLQPAIGLAREGYALAPRAAFDWKNHTQLLAADPNAARIFLPDGRPPAVGETHRQPELADSLELIAREGRRAFYEGDIAADIVPRLRELGGLHTREDFGAAAGEYVTPVSTEFRGHRIYECPPNGQGAVALIILNILSGIDAGEDPLSPDRLHAEIEATRLAYSVRDALFADPATGPIPIDWLLSEELASSLRAQIDLSRRLDELPCFPPPAHNDTVYISVVDKDRNAVSFINSLFDPFGSRIVSPRTGVLLQNRGQGFNLVKGHPNCIGPRKRPLHTIIPGMVLKDGRVSMSFGVMGGQYQAMGHAYFLARVLDLGMDIQGALELPRLFPIPGTDNVEIEGTMPAPVRVELERRGFRFVPAARPIGGGQVISIDWANGTLMGGSDPRKDGCALGMI